MPSRRTWLLFCFWFDSPPPARENEGMSRAHERQRTYQITATAAIPHDHAACPQFLERFRNFFATGTPLLNLESPKAGDCSALATIEIRTCGGKSINVLVDSLTTTFPKIAIKVERKFAAKKKASR